MHHESNMLHAQDPLHYPLIYFYTVPTKQCDYKILQLLSYDALTLFLQEHISDDIYQCCLQVHNKNNLVLH